MITSQHVQIALVALTVISVIVVVRSIMRSDTTADKAALITAIGLGALLMLLGTNLARMMLAADGVLAAVPQLLQ